MKNALGKNEGLGASTPGPSPFVDGAHAARCQIEVGVVDGYIAPDVEESRSICTVVVQATIFCSIAITVTFGEWLASIAIVAVRGLV